jgi:thioredoxin 1
MVILNSDNFKKEVEEHKGLVVIDFYADWCGPCKMLAPVFEELAAEMPEVKFCKVNVDNNMDLARMFKVESIPLVALVKDNTFVDMSLGFVPKKTLLDLINQYA